MRLVELLYDYPHMDEKIERIKAEIRRLSELKEGELKEGEKKAGERGGTPGTTVKNMERYEQQIRELTGMVEGLICRQDKIRLALFELSREEYRFVELKYFDRVKVEAMVRDLKRSRRSFYRLGEKVLERLDKRLIASIDTPDTPAQSDTVRHSPAQRRRIDIANPWQNN